MSFVNLSCYIDNLSLLVNILDNESNITSKRGIYQCRQDEFKFVSKIFNLLYKISWYSQIVELDFIYTSDIQSIQRKCKPSYSAKLHFIMIYLITADYPSLDQILDEDYWKESGNLLVLLSWILSVSGLFTKLAKFILVPSFFYSNSPISINIVNSNENINTSECNLNLILNLYKELEKHCRQFTVLEEEVSKLEHSLDLIFQNKQSTRQTTSDLLSERTSMSKTILDLYICHHSHEMEIINSLCYKQTSLASCILYCYKNQHTLLESTCKILNDKIISQWQLYPLSEYSNICTQKINPILELFLNPIKSSKPVPLPVRKINSMTGSTILQLLENLKHINKHCSTKLLQSKFKFNQHMNVKISQSSINFKNI